MQIGETLENGKPHDGRAPDYDDWALNADIVVYYPVLDIALELSSMGIRVDKKALLDQLQKAGCPERAELPYHKAVINGELPLTIGGGIGQSRICMFFLRKAHIGEVQCSLWSDEVMETAKRTAYSCYNIIALKNPRRFFHLPGIFLHTADPAQLHDLFINHKFLIFKSLLIPIIFHEFSDQQKLGIIHDPALFFSVGSIRISAASPASRYTAYFFLQQYHRTIRCIRMHPLLHLLHILFQLCDLIGIRSGQGLNAAGICR